MPAVPSPGARPLRSGRHPHVAFALIAANVAVFLFVEAGGIGRTAQVAAVAYGVIPAVFNGLASRPAEIAGIAGGVTLLAYAFLHAHLWHLLGNMAFIWLLADEVEDAVGHVRFLLLYCLSAVAGGYAYVVAAPDSPAPLIGASGAVAGIIAASLILHPRGRAWTVALARMPFRISSHWVLGLWLASQIYGAIRGAGGDRIAWSTHAAGFVTGAVLLPLLRRRGVVPCDRRAPAAAAAPVRQPGD